MCPLNWATQCPDAGQLLPRVCLWGCFWLRWAFESINWVKQITFPHVSEPHPINWGPDWNRKDWVGRNALCQAAGAGPPLCFWEENTGSSGVSSLLALELEFTSSVFLVLGLSESALNYTLAFLVLQQGDSRSGDFPVSIIMWASSLQYVYIYSFVCVCVCIYIYIYLYPYISFWFCFSGEPWLTHPPSNISTFLHHQFTSLIHHRLSPAFPPNLLTDLSGWLNSSPQKIQPLTCDCCLIGKTDLRLPWWCSRWESAGSVGSLPGLRRFHMLWSN